LIPGDRGIFDVTVDGRLVFSKHTEGRFPREDEILELLRSTIEVMSADVHSKR